MLYFTAIIYVKKGKEEIFYEYENRVLPLLEQYKGRLIYRIRPDQNSFIVKKGATPYEIHFLSFESEQDFQNYADDETRKQFMHLKKESIQATLLVKGEKI